MKTCTRCGASAYVDADPYCEHAYHEPPEPERVGPSWTLAGERAEMLYRATGPIGGLHHFAEHPTRDGAIALWQERWTWGPAIAALFGWLCEQRIEGMAVPGFYESQAAFCAHLEEQIAACIVGPDAYRGTVTIPPNATVTRVSAASSRGEPIGVCLGDGPPDEQGRPTAWVQLGTPPRAGKLAAARSVEARYREGLPTDEERARMQGRSSGVAYTLEEWAKHKRVPS